MRLAVLRVGSDLPPAERTQQALNPAVQLSAADAAGVDAALGELAGHRLVIDAADAPALNLALTRLNRAGLLGEVETAVLMPRRAGYLMRLGLPASRDAQLAVARSAAARLVGVLKDDSGGVCADSAVLTPWHPGDAWWVRAVVDDQRLCDGAAQALTVRRIGPHELEATVRLGRVRRRTCRGRSLQLACDEAQITADGVGRERPRRKRIFWSEPLLWRLALPAEDPGRERAQEPTGA